MGLIFISQLLLMTLLLQTTIENAEPTLEPDDSLYYGEFCLHIPNPHWTTSATQRPTESDRGKPKSSKEKPNKEPTQPLGNAPDAPSTQSTAQPSSESTKQPTQEPLMENFMKAIGHIQMAPLRMVSPCRCMKPESSLDAGIDQFESMLILSATETCSKRQFIGIKTDGQEVCVSKPIARAFLRNSLHRPEKPPIDGRSGSSAPLDTNTQEPIPVTPSLTQPTDPDPQYYDYESNLDIADQVLDTHPPDVSDECLSCPNQTDLNEGDLRSWDSLDVTMEQDSCVASIHVTLKNGRSSCLSSVEQLLEIALTELHEEGSPTDVATDGCRCKEMEKKLPDETSPVTRARIWRSSDTCNSTQIIETLMNDREVCVNDSSYLKYLDFILSRRREKPPIYGSSGSSALVDTYTQEPIIPPPSLDETQTTDPDPQYLESEPEYDSPAFIIVHPPHVSDECLSCPNQTDLNEGDLRSWDSLDVTMEQDSCVASIHVTLKNGRSSCLSSVKQLLEIALTELHEEGSPTDVATDGCRCKEMEKKLPDETSPVTRARIWRSSDTCNSTQIIETLMNGREVSVNDSSYLKYLDFILSKIRAPLVFRKGEREAEGAQMDWKDLAPLQPIIPVKVEQLEPLPKFRIELQMKNSEEEIFCIGCISPDWDHFDPQDVESLEMTTTPGCPAVVEVERKTKPGFCVLSSDSMFEVLLEKLDI